MAYSVIDIEFSAEFYTYTYVTSLILDAVFDGGYLGNDYFEGIFYYAVILVGCWLFLPFNSILWTESISIACTADIPPDHS